MQLEPRQLARDQRDLDVDLSLDEFPRLHALVVEALGPVVVRTRFRRDEQGRIRIDGQLRARLRMVCGNCSETGALELEVPVALCVVGSDEAARGLVEDLEPLVLSSPEATPADLFEDDLILALPDRPCFGRLDCPWRPVLGSRESEDGATEREPSPFAVLASLKRESD